MAIAVGKLGPTRVVLLCPSFAKDGCVGLELPRAANRTALDLNNLDALRRWARSKPGAIFQHETAAAARTKYGFIDYVVVVFHHLIVAGTHLALERMVRLAVIEIRRAKWIQLV